MRYNAGMPRISVVLDDKQHRAAKLRAIDAAQSLSEWVAQLVAAALANKPNKAA